MSSRLTAWWISVPAAVVAVAASSVYGDGAKVPIAIREAIFDRRSGKLTRTDVPVSDVRVMGYILSATGDTLIGNLWEGRELVAEKGQITLTFPTELMGSGYVVYFIKEGYIPWEQDNITFAGSGRVRNVHTVYLTKLRQSQPPLPRIRVIPHEGLSAGDLITVSVGGAPPINENVHPFQLPPELIPVCSYNAELTLEFESLNGRVVHVFTDMRTFRYSEPIRFDTTWEIPRPGEYNVTATTRISGEGLEFLSDHSIATFSLSVPTGTAIRPLNRAARFVQRHPIPVLVFALFAIASGAISINELMKRLRLKSSRER